MGSVESCIHAYDGAATVRNRAGRAIAASAIGWFQGYGRMYRDAETKFLYSVHRYYDPMPGRFLSEDPLGRWFDRASLGNGYSWSGNSYRNR